MGIEELVPDPRGRPLLPSLGGPTVAAAVIASDPADANDEVFVKLPYIDDGKFLHGPCPWMARIVDGANYGIPTTGDRAIVAFTEEKEPWIIMWWPNA